MKQMLKADKYKNSGKISDDISKELGQDSLIPTNIKSGLWSRGKGLYIRF